MGLGMGTAMLPLMTIAMSDVRPEDAGLGSGIINVSMQLAGALGIAILGTLASDRTAELTSSGESALSALTGGYTLAFQVAAGAVIVGIVIALVALRHAARARACPRLRGRRRGLTASAEKHPPARRSGRRRRTQSASPPAPPPRPPAPRA